MEVTFSLNQRSYTINPTQVPIETSLLVFIRSYARLTGTKFMCLEGGCGACIVNISGIRAPSGEFRTIAVNSCLWPVYACNGLIVTTIEGIGNLKDGYHPIQKALHHFNGTQCGYCSPGWVMNMYSLLESNGGKVTMQQVENAFGGNICRCTGYRPILDAFKSLATNACSSDIEDLTLDSCRLKQQDGSACSIQQICQRNCKHQQNNHDVSLELIESDGKKWLRPANLAELLKILTTQTMKSDYMLVAGNTAHGVYRRPENINIFIDIKSIYELHAMTADATALTIGANVSLTELMETLKVAVTKCDKYTYATELVKHLDLVATVPVRNAGTIAGNLSTKHAHNEFPSDVFLLLETIGARLNIVSIDGLVHAFSPREYLSLDMRQKVILNVEFPRLDPNRFVFRSYKIMPRAQNAHALVNAAFLFEFEQKTVKSCRICYGGINPTFIHAEATEKLLTGVNDLYSNEYLAKAMKSLQNELIPDSVLTDASAEYRKNLAMALFYRFLLATAPSEVIQSQYASGGWPLERALSSGSQIFQSNEKTYPLTQPTLKYEGLIQCAGEAEYVNDMFSNASNADEELWAAFVPATQVHSKIVQIDATAALKIPGVIAFFSAKDIPGENSFTPLKMPTITESEVIFIELDAKVSYHGQPCGVIVAKTLALANSAASSVEIVYEKLQQNQRPIVPSITHWRALTDRNTACEVSTETFQLFPNRKPSTASLGDSKKIKGDFEIGSQFHFSMEPQTTFCVPNDDGGINVYSATQWFDLTQIAISKSLKIQQSKITGQFKRLGGSYGGKFSRSAQVACACALACHKLRRPIRFVLTIESNMMMIGKRYANVIDYEASIDSATGQLQKFTTTISQDFGYSFNDDGSGVLFYCLKKSCYARAADWKITVNRVKTDAPSHTWCRSPGTTEAIACIENAMEHIARECNLDPAQVRLTNLDSSGSLHKIFPEFLKDTEYYQRKADINAFNVKNRWKKRGIAVSMMKFPIHYFTTFSVYVAIFHGDGTVVVSHATCEMGQGLNTKLAQIVAYTLGIPLELVTVSGFSTIIAANRSCTAGSIGSELICLVAKKACEHILERMRPIREKMPATATWTEIVGRAWAESIDLTQKELLKPTDAKSYDVVGCACAEIEMDVLTGMIQINRVDIVEDVGNSMNPLVDVGQIEGAFIMGIGYWLTEKLIYDGQTGELLTNRTWTYKVPGAKDIPIDFRIKFLQNVNNEGVFGSKATGEPAFTLACSVVFALRHAIDSVRSDNGTAQKWYRLGSGCTPDIVFDAANVNANDFKLN